ncbi:MAG: hypothetical protein Q8K46_01925, partial [Deltaproteobacteria bacterium]|nr:hypothetical protein [Deltaproteobacteria bacterium]
KRQVDDPGAIIDGIVDCCGNICDGIPASIWLGTTAGAICADIQYACFKCCPHDAEAIPPGRNNAGNKRSVTFGIDVASCAFGCVDVMGGAGKLACEIRVCLVRAGVDDRNDYPVSRCAL